MKYGAMIAAVLSRRGWCQGALGDEAGRVCLVGAVSELSPRYHSAAIRAVRRLLGCSLTVWNDSPGRTVEDVYAMLEAVDSQS